MDTVSPEKRSWIMSRIRGRDTSPELRLRRLLHRVGLRFRLHARLPGRPDLVLPRHRIAVFVHGCFFHAHGCRRSRLPKSNSEFWAAKFAGNTERDRRVVAALEAAGWSVLVLWECESLDPLKIWSFVHGVLARTLPGGD